MRTITLCSDTDFGGWRNIARALIQAQVPPEDVHWQVEGSEASLFSDPADRAAVASPVTFTVPREFVQLARRVAIHSDPTRFALLYRLLWRLRSEPRLLDIAVDVDVARATAMAKSVSRDLHKMKAFVRFREVNSDESPAFVAWFEPEHHIVEAVAPFFVRRFAGQRWSILTPTQSAHWDGRQLSFGPGGVRSDAPAEDAREDLWRRYYASIFNPARLKVATMRGQMPAKYWHNLPEAALIPSLIELAGQRTRQMIDAAPTVARRSITAPAKTTPAPRSSHDQLNAAAARCRSCPLWANATQIVFGEGPVDSPIMLVGEQPGDQEDLAGRPFVGPAGKLLNGALKEAGLSRDGLYVTNAVKHFKFEPRGKRRLHKKPAEAEIAACEQWLRQELSLIAPRLVVALGATAARAVTGRTVGIERSRGHIIRRDSAPDLLITVHPSYLLRIPENEQKAALERFVADLQLASDYLRTGSGTTASPPIA